MRQVDALGHETTFTYDANGNQLTSTTTQTAADGTVRTLTTRTDYDADGRVITVTDPEGGITRTEYDAAGNRTAKIDASAGALNTVTMSGTNSSRPFSRTPRPPTRRTIPAQRAQYDAAGREIARIDELGQRTEYAYDAAGRRVRTIYPTLLPPILLTIHSRRRNTTRPGKSRPKSMNEATARSSATMPRDNK